MNYKNGFFQLCHKEDGTYLKIFPAVDKGKPLLIDDVLWYLHQKKIENYDVALLNHTIVSAKDLTEIKLMGNRILPENEFLKLTITDDRRMVIGRFYPPSSKGKFINKEEILRNLSDSGVEYGVQVNTIEKYLKNRQFCFNITLAKATLPIEGKSAKITYCFDIEKKTKPKINEDGSVDFHQLDNINHVNKGDVLATLCTADTGTSGMDVCGNILRPIKVRQEILRHGNNIHLSEDGLTMYADVSGHVSLANGQVFVSNTYEVPADVGSSTGDIQYDGNVLIKGNVLTGFTVKAKGDIIVEGVVEGAVLEADGQIILKRGIQGMGRGSLYAKGDIVTKFIERSNVTAGGSITTDAIMHSMVSAGNEIVVSGRRGLVTGGTIKSGFMISVKTVGSTMGANTTLEVGVNTELMEEFHNIENEITNKIEEKEKLGQMIALFTRKITQGEKLESDKIKLFQDVKVQYDLVQQQIEEYKRHYYVLEEELNNLEDGYIQVENIVYPGVKIVIANIITYIKTETQHCRFVREKADIKITGF